MTDLADIALMAFADDGIVCLVVAAFASLIVTPRLKPGRVALATFIVCWAFPILMLAGAYDRTVAATALGHAVMSLPGDIVWLTVRFGGIYAVIAVLWRARLALHGQRPVARVEARGGAGSAP